MCANLISSANSTSVRYAKKIRVSFLPPQKAPIKVTPSAPPTNSRLISCSYQTSRIGPNTPCHLKSIGRYKLRLTMMIAMTTIEAMLMGVPVTVGEQLEARKLSGSRGPDIDLSWHYLPP